MFIKNQHFGFLVFWLSKGKNISQGSQSRWGFKLSYLCNCTINLPWQLKLGHHQRRPQKYKNNHGRKSDSNVKILSERNKLRKRNNRPTYAYKKQFDAKSADKYSLYKTRSKRSEPAFSLADFCSYIASSSYYSSGHYRGSGSSGSSGSSLCGSSSGDSSGDSSGSSSPGVQVKFVKE